MADNLVLRRLLWALTSVVLVVGLMAVPVVGDDDDGGLGDGVATGSTRSEVGGRDVAASTVPPTSGDGGDPAPGATTTTPAGETTSVPTTSVPETTAAPSTSTPPPTFPPAATDLGAPQDPGPSVAPRAGLYRYKTTTSGEDGAGEATVRVVERGRSAGEVRLAMTVASEGATVTNEQTWRAEGVRTLRSTFAFGAQSADCDWEPDVVEQIAPLTAGATWSSESSCTVTFGATAVVVKRSIRAEVVDLRRVKVDGQVVDVWAIRRVEQLSGAGQSGSTTALALYSPKHGIDVDVQGTADGGGRAGDYHQELLHLAPEA